MHYDKESGAIWQSTVFPQIEPNMRSLIVWLRETRNVKHLNIEKEIIRQDIENGLIRRKQYRDSIMEWVDNKKESLNI